MFNRDRAQFAQAMSMLAVNFQHELTDPELELWWKCANANNITLEQFQAGVFALITQRKARSFPVFGEFMSAVCMPTDEEKMSSRANEAADQIIEEVTRRGRYVQPLFRDPLAKYLMSTIYHFRALCDMTEDELKWWKRDFVKSYQQYARRHDEMCLLQGKVPKKLEAKIKNLLPDA